MAWGASCGARSTSVMSCWCPSWFAKDASSPTSAARSPRRGGPQPRGGRRIELERTKEIGVVGIEAVVDPDGGLVRLEAAQQPRAA